ncbi:exodeoxyribonuclease V subunit gamma [Candidatus Vallotiella sp. (ex Adelges kitamiensis)]|uniref:exodeoxyribonuclease V subunit gamma n=1 Tax=Candidatus Vallotiella sp. (ex Adelges kitamiensis) TaxID=2864217 RepID=UPI001CE39FE7|nr:exodeoxyribonuclease V subunit gamma [Candidatus Vallotia sp. (ex Adelges kitamiensis)]
MIELFYSNRYEVLTMALFNDLERIGSDVWKPQTIIIPNVAIRRRIELDYADRFGVCANIEFCYLYQWLWSQISRVKIINAPRESPFVPERLVWRLYKLLFQRSRMHDGNSPAPLVRLDPYLALADPVMMFDLARRMSFIFNHYMTYRPRWLAQWQAGESIFSLSCQPDSIHQITNGTIIQRADEAWQAQLWRDVLQELSGGCDASTDVFEWVSPPACRFLEIASQLNIDDIANAGYPAQVSVFALPIMPPLHVQLLRVLSRWIDVRIYALNPCREYSVVSVNKRYTNTLDSAEQLEYPITGHPLLAEWGRQTQEQLALLHEHIDGAMVSENSKFVEAPAHSWLAILQNSILSLKHRALPSLPPTLNGIEVHICYSLMRQFEVLHDRLLAEFNLDPNLTPADILIVVPDLIIAAPIVNAVFGTVPLNDPCRIPYCITGLPLSQTNTLTRTLLDWLTLGDRAVNASSLIEWLRVDEISTRYDIDLVALETVQRWLKDAGARRSFLPHEHQDFNLPQDRHTFYDALMRLFLGYAMPDNAQPIGGWLPVAAPIGADAILLGRLAQFVDDLDAFALICATPKTVTQWRDVLNSALEQFFGSRNSNSDSLSRLSAVLNTLFVQIELDAPHTLLPASVLRAALLSAIHDPTQGGVPSGAVTVSSLSSLRSISFRIICIAGVDNGVLPIRARPDEFDLMAFFEQPGDWKRRDNERNLFLELILAARDTVLISYTGRNICDNSELPPSVLLTELLDYLASLKSGEVSSTDEIALARRSFIIEHPLQSFSLLYLKEPLLTYDPDRSKTATALADPMPQIQTDTMALFFSSALPPDVREMINLEELTRFWRHPHSSLLRERLGIVLHRAETKLLDTEPYAFSYVARDALAKRILPLLIESSAYLEQAYEIASTIPGLPRGAVGRVIKEREVIALSKLADKIRECSGAGLKSVEFSIRVAPNWPKELRSVSELLDRMPAWSRTVLLPSILTGTLDGATRNKLVLYRYARPTGRDYLDTWLRHLFWCAESPKASRQTLWIGCDTHFMFTTPQNPHIYLGELCALYRAGLRVPLRFFPKSGWLFVSKGASAGYNAWSNDRTGGEHTDPAIQLAFRGTSMLLDDTSIAISKTVFEPLLAHLQPTEETS